MTLLFLGSIGITEILVLLLIVLLIFGAKKIPELMKSFGKGVKSFKEGINGIEEDINVLLIRRRTLPGRKRRSSRGRGGRDDILGASG